MIDQTLNQGRLLVFAVLVFILGFTLGFGAYYFIAQSSAKKSAASIAELQNKLNSLPVPYEFLSSPMFRPFFSQVGGIVAAIDSAKKEMVIQDSNSSKTALISLKEVLSVAKIIASGSAQPQISSASLGDISVGDRVTAYVEFIGGVPSAVNLTFSPKIK